MFQKPIIKNITKFYFCICINAISIFAQNSDTLKANSSDSLFMKRDSTFLLSDSLKAKSDSSVAYYDSLSVIRDSLIQKLYPYKRKDNLSAQIFEPEKNIFYLIAPTNVLMKEVKLDSTGKFVIVRELVNGKDVKIPLVYPIAEYIRYRMQDDIKKNFELFIHKPSDKKKTDGLGEIISTFTNIDIPIPPNPVFSIFGPPRINLQISGQVDIHTGFRNIFTDQVTTSLLGQSRNEPDFSQEVQISVSGTIGDKLNILADWNTQRTFEYENQLRIKYTGYDDEIVQSVEAGNVSLGTASSFISSSSALFGIKSVMQFGKLKLTAIASQKKGQIQEKTISGGAQEIPFEKRAYEYSRDHYFVDTSYIKLFEPFYTTLQGDASKQLVDYEIYVTHSGPLTQKEFEAVAFIDLPMQFDSSSYKDFRKITTTIPGEVEVGDWDKLEPREYTMHELTGYVTFNRTIQDGQAIAIAYRVANGAGADDDIFYGEFLKRKPKNDSIYVLKLIKPKTLLPQNKVAWKLMLKNIYSLGGRNIKESGFDLQINYQLPGKEPINEIAGVKTLQLFGFDRFNSSGGNLSDNNFDYKPPYTIDESRGEVIFPSIEPFRKSIENYFKINNISVPPDSFIYAKIYDTTQLAAQYETSRDRFTIKGKTTAGSSSTIQLGFNIVEGSVEVLLDGNPMIVNIDYTVDYILGQIIIKNQTALIPGANLQVKFEQNDLFQLASKTLMAIRGELPLSEKTFLGFTLMNLDQQTLSDKVRLGDEPTNNTIFGIDGTTSGKFDLLTKAIDLLPGISTNAPSDYSLRGEFAYMSPDPNTKKSTIVGDGSKGIAYIDDFEGAKRIIPLGVHYAMWQDMNPPANLSDQLQKFSKAKTYWFTVQPSDVSVSEIWGDKKKVARGADLVMTLNLNYNPRERGQYNFSTNLQQTILDNPKANWGGIQRSISSSAVDFVKENITFIEFWAKIEKGKVTKQNKIYIDLGMISEDIILNNKIDTEEKGYVNGILGDNEDNGIDGLTNAEEKVAHSDFVQQNKNIFPSIETDPAGDDYNYQQLSLNYKNINGTEGNRISETGRLPESEDINHNNNFDRTDSYFEYEVNLDTTDLNPLRVGKGSNGWYQYRIPVNEFSRKVGVPDFSLIESVRLWLTEFDSTVQIRFAELNLVGNQWEEIQKNDSTMRVSTVNYEDNPDYTIPPGVIRERDRTRPDEEVYGNEQSLSLALKKLKDGESRFAIKRYSYKPLDVFSYKELKMFVHGQEQRALYSQFSDDPTNPDAMIVFRFGIDTLNYYEYRTPILPGWNSSNEIKIRFEELTAIKQGRDSSNLKIIIPVKNGPIGATFGVLGNPTLTRVTFIAIGVENPIGKGTATPLSGEVWINELRLTDVDDTPGWAYSFSSQVKLADVGSIAVSFSEVDPNFHGLEQKFGSRTTNRSWNVSTSLAMDKFLPDALKGSTLPFSYSHSEVIMKPKFLPSSDILIDEAAKRQYDIVKQKTGSEESANKESDKLIFETQTLTITDTYALPNFAFQLPFKNFLAQDFFNKLNFGFTYTSSQLRTPTVQYQNSWSWNARTSYQKTLEDYSIEPFSFLSTFGISEWMKDFKLHYIPITNYSINLTAARLQRFEKLRDAKKESAPSRNLSANRSFAFGWKLTENGFLNLNGDYSVDISSTLAHLELDRFGRQKNFNDILSELFLKDQLVNFGYDFSYNQSVRVNMQPPIPDIFDLKQYLTMTSAYSVGYRWGNNFQQGPLGKGAGWSNNISANVDFSLKSFVDSWFPKKGTEQIPQTMSVPTMRGDADRESDDDEVKDVKSILEKPDTTKTPIISDSTITEKSKSIKESLINISRSFIKTPLLDFEKLSLTYTQSNTSQNGGIYGRPGFGNLFARVPFAQSSLIEFGPTRSYQLGLVSDPTSEIDFQTQRAFPFVKLGVTERGLRAPNANLNDAFNQSNKFTLRTSRDLWEGANLDLNWSLTVDYSRNMALKTDSLGRAEVQSTATSGALEKSFLSFPPIFIFSIFNSGIGQVGKDYNKLRDNLQDTRSEEEKISEAFESGFESLPILSKILGEFAPKLNYSLRWGGLEKIPLLQEYVSNLSLDHVYQSTYRKSYKGNLSGGRIIEGQRLQYGFSPLLGMNVTFKEILKGNMNANFRYNTQTAFDLVPAARNISENSMEEISVTGGFSRSGFEIPLFGVSFSNDIDISFTYSYSHNSRQTFEINSISEKGIPGEGSSRTQFEPRIRYVLSARVNASFFYRYTKIAPDEGGSRIPGSTTNEGGLDISVAIR